jgi:hypothetical protein
MTYSIYSICLICLQDINNKQYITTNYCSCVQNVHQNCFEDWIYHNNDKVKCIICKKTEVINIICITNIHNILKFLFDFILSNLMYTEHLIFVFIFFTLKIYIYNFLFILLKIIYKIKKRLTKRYIIHNS